MFLEMILAMDPNGVIGHQNKLPWNYPEELKFFQTMTLNKTIVMGRKTFESLSKPLRDRRHLVITSQTFYDPPYHLVDANPITMNLDDFIYFQDANYTRKNPDPLIIIGGKTLYEELLPLVRRIFLTRILDEYPGDTQMSQNFLNQINEESSIWDRHLITTNTQFEIWKLLRV